MESLLNNLLSGDTRSLARVISLVENRAPNREEILSRLFPHAGRARVIGVTGSPGVGKSSLVDRLAAHYRGKGFKPGIIAVDPTSAFTGGAILGDRIRMNALSSDPGIFIRSMATRGHLGGVASATADVVLVLDAAARDPVIIETVGVGQDEIDIARLADLSIVVLVPGMGDDVQALKAGIMEIGDIFVINKCDRPGVEKMERTLSTLLSLVEQPGIPSPPVVKTIATDGAGIDELAGHIDAWYELRQGNAAMLEKRRESARQRLLALIREHALEAVLRSAFPDDELEAAAERIAKRETDPYSLVREKMKRFETPTP
jgi:LAO/AO transport system kinase